MSKRSIHWLSPIDCHHTHMERGHFLTPGKAWWMIDPAPSALELKQEASNGVFQEHIAGSMSTSRQAAPIYLDTRRQLYWSALLGAAGLISKWVNSSHFLSFLMTAALCSRSTL